MEVFNQCSPTVVDITVQPRIASSIQGMQALEECLLVGRITLKAPFHLTEGD